jgi:hypothetical protein
MKELGVTPVTRKKNIFRLNERASACACAGVTVSDPLQNENIHIVVLVLGTLLVIRKKYKQ